jgi:ribosomal protein S18 acetylase RimI-like enzyme
VLRRARPTDGPGIADVYVRSFGTALPSIRLVHTEAEVREHFATTVTNEQETWVAVDRDHDEEKVMGFVALGDDGVDHLYVAPEHAGRGVGSALLDVAKRERPDGLRLFTFQVNTRARAFYEHRGFEVVDLNDGDRNQEGEPDVLYAWRP